MKKTLLRGIAVCLMITLLCGAVMAAGEIYVNDANGTLSTGIEDAYAVGSGSVVSKLGERRVYAQTSTGLQMVGSGTKYENVPVSVDKVRVGLFFGSDTLAEAQLELDNGDGFNAGYYDGERNFVSIGYVRESRVNVVPDRNAEIRAGTTGAYHIRLNKTYASYDDARRDADQFGGYPAWLNGKLAVLKGSFSTQENAQKAISDQ